MKKLQSKTARVLLAVAAGLCLSVATVAPAQAFDQIELNQACRLKDYGHHVGGIGWTAQLTYPSQGVYGWRCFYYDSPSAPTTGAKYGMSVQLLCDNIYGGTAKFTKQSDANSWYCG